MVSFEPFAGGQNILTDHDVLAMNNHAGLVERLPLQGVAFQPANLMATSEWEYNPLAIGIVNTVLITLTQTPRFHEQLAKRGQRLDWRCRCQSGAYDRVNRPRARRSTRHQRTLATVVAVH